MNFHFMSNSVTYLKGFMAVVNTSFQETNRPVRLSFTERCVLLKQNYQSLKHNPDMIYACIIYPRYPNSQASCNFQKTSKDSSSVSIRLKPANAITPFVSSLF